jgi:hypothetical protein
MKNPRQTRLSRCRVNRPAGLCVSGKWLVLILAALAGCGGPPQVGAGNYRLIESLRTAISARRSDWLEENAKLASLRHAAGELNDEQFAAFESIIAQARGGNWADAESEVIRFAKAQRLSADEIEERKAKQAPAKNR